MKTILLVDDDLNQAEAIASSLVPMLIKLGFALQVETDCSELFTDNSTIGSSQLVGAILDLWMVDKDTRLEDKEMGIKVLHRIRSLFPKCPVVILSAHLSEDLSKKIQAFPRVSTVKKPASALEILECILPVQELKILSGT